MSKTRQINRILERSNLRAREDGLNWYKILNRYCRDLSEKYNSPIWKTCAIMSVLSPRTSFNNNVHDLEKMLKYGSKAKLKSPLFRDKALRVMNCENYTEVKNLFNEKTGRKTLSFWENLMLVGNRVTIDVHMIRHLGIKGSLTDKKYREAEKSIQDYSKKVGLKPYELQAVLWCIVRKESF